MDSHYRMQDDSVTVRGKGAVRHAGKSVTTRGEDRLKAGVEPGRGNHGEHASSSRTHAHSSARDVTGVAPEDPIDPKMPNLR